MDKDIKESREYRLAKDWERQSTITVSIRLDLQRNTDHAPDTAAKPVQVD